MSYDLSLFLKRPPELSAERFGEICQKFGLTVELCPDFTVDGTLSPLCAKFGGLFENDDRSFLGVVEYDRSKTENVEAFTLPGPKKKWWQLKKPKGETLEVPADSERLFFSCGMDSLEMPFALLVAYALAGEDGILIDPQKHNDCIAVGQAGIEKWLTAALDELKTTPSDRLLLHEFDEWL